MRRFSIPTLIQPKGKLLLLSALAIAPLASCEKKAEPEAQANAVTASAAEVAKAVTEAPAATGWIAEAPKLGFSAFAPLESQLYFASVNWPKHYAALQATHYWKQVGSFLEDKVPAPAAGEDEVDLLDIDLFDKEFFLLGGKGTDELIRIFFQLNALQTEGTIYTALSGVGSIAPAEVSGLTFLNSSHTVAKFKKLIDGFQVPAFFAGYQVEDAAKEAEKQIAETLKKLADKQQGKLGEISNAQGVKFTTLDSTIGAQFTPEQIQKAVEDLGTDDAHKAALKEVLDQVAAIPLRLAIGHHQGFVIFATYRDAADLDFAKSPEASVLAHEKFKKLEGHIGKNLLSLSFLSKSLFDAVLDSQSIEPLIDGFSAALQQTDSTKNVLPKIQGDIDALVASHDKLYDFNNSDAVSVAYWDNGLRAENIGGADFGRQYDLVKPLQYAKLLKNSNLVFGVNGHTQPSYTEDLTIYLENFASVGYKVAKELAQTGLFGAEATQQVAMAEMMVIPTWSKIYGNLKDLFLKGTNTETFIGLDLLGPNELAGEPDKKTFPRLYSVQDVKDDAVIRSSWNEVHTTITGLLGMFGMGGDPTQPGSGFLPEATSQPVAGDLVQWHYQTPFLSGDLSPNAVLSSKHLVLSSSLSAGKEIAEALEAPSTREINRGLHLIVNFKHLKSLVETGDSLKGKTATDGTEDAAATGEENAANFERFIAPLETLRAEFQKDDTNDVRTIIDWDMKDIKSFD